MRILFLNIAWMKEYRGNEDGNDKPVNGGSYVDETGRQEMLMKNIISSQLILMVKMSIIA